MIFVTTAFLLAISGTTAALAPAVSHAIDSCIRRAGRRDGQDDSFDESPHRQAVVIHARPHRLADSRRSSSRNNDAGSFFILLQLHVGRQLIRVNSLDSAVRLYNFWSSISCPPTPRGAPQGTTERILLWQGGAGHIPTRSDGIVREDNIGGGNNGGAVVRLSAVAATATAVSLAAAPAAVRCIPPSSAVTAASIVAEENKDMASSLERGIPAASRATTVTAASVAAEEDNRQADSPDGAMAATSRAMGTALRPPALSLGDLESAFSSSDSGKTTGVVAGSFSSISPLSPEQGSVAAPSRGRRRNRQGPTSPRARSSRPPSPRRRSVPLPRPPSPQRSGTAVRTSAGEAAAAAACTSRTIATRRQESSVLLASRLKQAPGVLEDAPATQASFEKAGISRSTTPPLTPASTRSSTTTTTTSVAWNNIGIGTFFGDHRGGNRENGNNSDKESGYDGAFQLSEGDTGGTVARSSAVMGQVSRAEQHINGVKHVLEEQQQVEQKKRQTKSLKTAVNSKFPVLGKVGIGLADRGGLKKTFAEARSGGGIDDSEDEWTKSGAVDPRTGEFGPIVEGVGHGQLRKMFISNLRKTRWGGLGHACAQMRMATLSLIENVEPSSVMGVLEEVEVLGEGSFGVVSAAHHSTLGGSFAIKKLKAGASSSARYCATVEMIALARLAAAPPHGNVVSAVCIDDRKRDISSMPILLHRADNDLGRVLRTGDWGMPEKLGCLEQIASGVRHMHKQGIGHGDIKLENILLYSDGDGGCDPKLCDFGMSRALGELRPSMMGTPGYMPLEVMLASVQTHESQDTFAMAAMALFVCVPPEKAQSNMFTSPELYSEKEAKRKKALDEMEKGDPLVEAQTQMFQLKMTKRTMGDGSFAKLLAPEKLHRDLGFGDVRDMVYLCLPPFLDKNPDNRPDLASFQEVMKNLAVEATNNNGGSNAVQMEANDEEDDTGRRSGEEEDGDEGDGIDLDDHDDDYFEEDGEIF